MIPSLEKAPQKRLRLEYVDGLRGTSSVVCGTCPYRTIYRRAIARIECLQLLPIAQDMVALVL
jgi:hypothetical protein